MTLKSIPFSSTVKPEKIPPTLIFIDTETYTDGDYQRLMLGCAEIWKVTRQGLPHKRYQVERRLFRSEDEYYNLIRAAGPCRVVAHNWQFDASVLRIGSRATMTKYEYDLDPTKGIYPAGGSGFSPFWIMLRWADGTECELIDNTNFHKTSLSKLGESYGMSSLARP